MDLKHLAHEWSEQRDSSTRAAVTQTGADNVESLWICGETTTKNTLEGELWCQLAAHP